MGNTSAGEQTSKTYTYCSFLVIWHRTKTKPKRAITQNIWKSWGGIKEDGTIRDVVTLKRLNALKLQNKQSFRAIEVFHDAVLD